MGSRMQVLASTHMNGLAFMASQVYIKKYAQGLYMTKAPLTNALKMQKMSKVTCCEVFFSIVVIQTCTTMATTST